MRTFVHDAQKVARRFTEGSWFDQKNSYKTKATPILVIVGIFFLAPFGILELRHTHQGPKRHVLIYSQSVNISN